MPCRLHAGIDSDGLSEGLREQEEEGTHVSATKIGFGSEPSGSISRGDKQEFGYIGMGTKHAR